MSVLCQLFLFIVGIRILLEMIYNASFQHQKHCISHLLDFLVLFWKDAYFFEVKVNGVRKVHVENNNPQHFTNVKVFAGDYHEPADAYIRFFYACQIKGLL